MKTKYGAILLFSLIPVLTNGQTNNLTGSPYSLFGLGVQTNANIGRNSALGRGGFALSGEGLINALNPASYGAVPQNSFLFDFGFLTEFSTLANRSTEENRIAGSFSNIAFAASITPKSAFGISITPFTDVGYSLIGIESNVEGSLDEFTSNVFGSGALNDFKLTYGHSLSPKFRLGLNLSYLFGTIEEQETVNASVDFINQSTLTITDENRYYGFRLGLGAQFALKPELVFAVGVDLPTSLEGSRDRSVQKTLDFIPFDVSTEDDIDLASFKLPLEFNSGIFLKPLEGLGINIDYALKLWETTEQRDNIGNFKDQYLLSIGSQFVPDVLGRKLWQRLNFRAGFQYDSGYLTISDTSIDEVSFTAGLGIPISNRSSSSVNISFARSYRGNTGGFLVEEITNTINVNISLKDFWFLKRKIE